MSLCITVQITYLSKVTSLVSSNKYDTVIFISYVQQQTQIEVTKNAMKDLKKKVDELQASTCKCIQWYWSIPNLDTLGTGEVS